MVWVDDEFYFVFIELVDFDDFLYDFYMVGVYVGVGKVIEEFFVIVI